MQASSDISDMLKREAQRLLDRDPSLRFFMRWCQGHNADPMDRATLDAYAQDNSLGRAEVRRLCDGAAALSLILRGESRESLALSLLGSCQITRREAQADGEYGHAAAMMRLEADMLGLRTATVRLVADKAEQAGTADVTEMSDAELLELIAGDDTDDPEDLGDLGDLDL